jgi:hypothetical protein
VGRSELSAAVWAIVRGARSICSDSKYVVRGISAVFGPARQRYFDGPDADYWQVGLGVRVHLGSGGTLKDRNRSEPLQSVPPLRVTP